MAIRQRCIQAGIESQDLRCDSCVLPCGVAHSYLAHQKQRSRSTRPPTMFGRLTQYPAVLYLETCFHGIIHASFCTVAQLWGPRPQYGSHHRLSLCRACLAGSWSVRQSCYSERQLCCYYRRCWRRWCLQGECLWKSVLVLWRCPCLVLNSTLLYLPAQQSKSCWWV